MGGRENKAGAFGERMVFGYVGCKGGGLFTEGGSDRNIKSFFSELNAVFQ